MIVKPEKLEKSKIAKQLVEINLDEKGNMLSTSKAEHGHQVHGLFSKIDKQDIITIDEIKKFKKESVFCRKHNEENFRQKSFYL